MPLPADHWQRALALMDTAVTLRPEQRDAWLDEIAAAEPQVAPLLRKLLSAHQRVETNDILATLPRPDRQTQHPSNGEIGAQIGPFELIELLGHGGMGSVWRARYADGRLKRDVAVKLPATSDNPAALSSLRERFARERDFLAQLEHPNIARLYDTGISDSGQPYLAMEYVAGEPIDAFCDKQRLTIKARLTLYLQVLDAVEFAHRQLVLHRDLKPGNVLVDGNGQARLLDFGVAKLLPETSVVANPATTISAGSDLTEMAGAAITLAYAAPEQINHGRLSTATDVYALGVMLYRLLTGSAPYQPKRDTRGALEDEVLAVDPANASTRFAPIETLEARQTTQVALRRTLAGDIDTILAKALKKNADERYPTVAALAEDLRKHLTQQPIAARADSLWYLTSRVIARHRVAVAASVLGVTALIATTGVAVWQAKVATASAARANKEATRVATAQKVLTGIFSNADPEQSRGDSITAREILERGLASAEKELADDPEALALVLTQIGDIYYRLGLPEQLLAVQRRRVTVLETMPGADVNALVDAQLALGQALGETGESVNTSAALSLLLQALDTARTRGAEQDRVVWALALVADRHRLDRRLESAQGYIAQALALATHVMPEPQPKLAEAHAINAVIARDQGRIEDARRAFEETVAINATGRGHGKVEQIDILNHFAQLEFDSSDYLAAERRALDALQLAKGLPGDLGINIAPARRIAVLAALFAGDYAGAQRLSDDILAPELNAKHPLRSGTARLVNARLAWMTGNFDSAERDLALAEPLLSPHAQWAVRWAVAKSELDIRRDRIVTAESRLQTVLAEQSKSLGPDNIELAPALEWLGVAHAKLNQPSVAQNYFSKSCMLRARSRAINHPARVRCDAYLVLSISDASSGAKATSLQALQAVVSAQRKDDIALLRSLHQVRKTLEQSSTSPTLFGVTFPILN